MVNRLTAAALNRRLAQSLVWVTLVLCGCVGGDAVSTGAGTATDSVNPIERGAFVPYSWRVPALRLYITIDTRYIATCTASKIGTHAFVTAAHCLDDDGRTRDSFQIGGTVLVSNRRGVGGTFARTEGMPFRVVRTHVYPGRNPVTLTGDIAIVVVDHELFPDYPIGVLTEATASLATVGRTVATYGYGCTENESEWDLRDELRWGATVLRENEGAIFRTQRDGTGPDLCVGDSGGPVQPAADAENGFSNFRIIAINSHMRARSADVARRFDGHTPIRAPILQWANSLRWIP